MGAQGEDHAEGDGCCGCDLVQLAEAVAAGLADDHDLHGLLEIGAGTEERAVGEGVAAGLAGEGGEDGLGATAVLLVAGEMPELGRDPGHGAVAAGVGAVMADQGADDEAGIRCGLEVDAAVGVEEVLLGLGEPDLRRRQHLALAQLLEEGDGGLAHLGIVVDEGGLQASAVQRAVGQAVAVGAERPADGAERVAGHPQPLGPAAIAGGLGEAPDHQAVPVGQHLVVAGGWDAPVAGGEEALAVARKLLGFLGAGRPGSWRRLRMLRSSQLPLAVTP